MRIEHLSPNNQAGAQEVWKAKRGPRQRASSSETRDGGRAEREGNARIRRRLRLMLLEDASRGEGREY